MEEITSFSENIALKKGEFVYEHQNVKFEESDTVNIEYGESEDENEDEEEDENEDEEEQYLEEDMFDRESEDDENEDNEDNDEDQNSVVSDTSHLTEQFEYDFGDFQNVFDLIISEDSGFYSYITSTKFIEACVGKSPIYCIYKIYRLLAFLKPSTFLDTENVKLISFIMSYVYEFYPFIEEDEIENILMTRNMILFRLFIETCTTDDGPTNYFFQDLINSEKFHKDKIDFILTVYGGLLSPLIFAVFIENGNQDYGNEDTYDYLMNMFTNEIPNLTDEQLKIIEDEADLEIQELVSEFEE